MASKLARPGFSSSARVPSLTRCVRAAILLFLLVWFIVSLVHDTRLLVRSYTPLPFWDDWRVIQHFQAYKHHQLSIFFQQQNEHRIIFPELIFALDDLLFHARRLLTISSNCFFYLGTWWLLGSSLPSARTGNRFACWCAILVAGILLAWPGSTLVLGTPFQLQWILEGFALAGALVFIAKTGGSRGSIHLAMAIAFAVIATFSSANGLFVWPVLLAAGFILRLGKGRISALGISAIVSIALFFTGYTFSPQFNWGLLFRHPLLFIGFVATYMGVPFSPVSEWVGILVGLASMIAFACLAVAAWRQNLLRSRPGIVLCGFYLLILVTAAMTAIGRMDPNSPSWFGARHGASISCGPARRLGRPRHARWLDDGNFEAPAVGCPSRCSTHWPIPGRSIAGYQSMDAECPGYLLYVRPDCLPQPGIRVAGFRPHQNCLSFSRRGKKAVARHAAI